MSILQEELETANNVATDLEVFLGLRTFELKVEDELLSLETLKMNKAVDEVYIILDIAPTIRPISDCSESFQKCNFTI